MNVMQSINMLPVVHRMKTQFTIEAFILAHLIFKVNTNEIRLYAIGTDFFLSKVLDLSRIMLSL